MIASSLRAPSLPTFWRAPCLSLLALLTVLMVQYRETVAGMVAIWLRSETFTHAFVVAPIALWLVWRQRERLADLLPQPQYAMLVPMALLALVWLAGELVVANSISQLAFTAMLVVSVPTVLGLPVARALTFPLMFLFFSVPIGDFLTPYMMQWTADFTVQALRMSGIPVYREGLQFVIPSGTWSVVEACSGLRYLMASFMVGSLFAYLNYQTPRRRLAFVAVAIAMPIVANWLRAYMIVMLGHLSGNVIATGADHLVYGWVFFGIVIMAMFFIGARWAEPEPSYRRTGAAGAGENALPSPGTTAMGRRAWTISMLSIGLLLMPQMLLQRMARGDASITPHLGLPTALAGAWQAKPVIIDDWRPILVGPSLQTQRVYSAGAGNVGLHIAYYRDQSVDRKLVSSSNLLVPVQDPKWNVLARAHHAVETQAGIELTVNATEIISNITPTELGMRQRLLVWQWYWVGGRQTHSDLAAKLLGAWQRLSGQGDESAAVFIYTLEPVSVDASARMDDFLRSNATAIDALLQLVR